MLDTNSMNPEFVNIAVDKDGLRSKLENGIVGAELRNIWEDEDVLQYFNKRLVQTVKMYAREFLTESGRECFNYITQRDNLFENFKLNLETNLLSNALTAWFKMSYKESLEDIMLKILDVDFAKKVIDTLVEAFEKVKERIKTEELKAFADGSGSFFGKI